MFEVIFLMLVSAAVCVWVFARPKFSPPKTAPSDQRTYNQFEAAPSLFASRAELRFFLVLVRVIPEDYFVMSKVRLEDIIGVKPSVKNAEARWKLRARVKSRHVDFLIIDNVGAPVMAIELDGPHHDGPEAFHSDTLKNGLFKAANIPLRRIGHDEDYLQRCQALISEIVAQ
ncbi:MAG: DUF2726 domain-containing protein [Alphaproteobacteria bacterium]